MGISWCEQGYCRCVRSTSICGVGCSVRCSVGNGCRSVWVKCVMDSVDRNVGGLTVEARFAQTVVRPFWE